jgi:hypothetical protein
VFQPCFNLNRIPVHDSVGKTLRTANQGCSLVSSSCGLGLMHLSILIPGGKGAGNGWGFDKKFQNWVKCPLVGHSKIIKCFKTDAPRG